MFDELDMKIIALLEENGRASYTQLADSLGITDNTVAKRIESLLDNKAISIVALTELQKMGYKAQSLIALNVAADKIEKLCLYLANNSNVTMISHTLGHYNLVIMVSYFTWEDFQRFVSLELSTREEILNMEVYFIKQALRPPFKVLKESELNRDTENIDNTDRKIINELCNNGRYTARNLSERLNISESSAAQRINRLLARQVIVIRGIRGPALLENEIESLVLLKTTPRRIVDIISSLHSETAARGILILANGFDLYVRLVASCSTDVFEIIQNKISRSSGIGISKMETLVVAKKIPRVNNLPTF
jgi:DNA-binding Lrp family transcriptional regulator